MSGGLIIVTGLIYAYISGEQFWHHNPGMGIASTPPAHPGPAVLSLPPCLPVPPSALVSPSDAEYLWYEAENMRGVTPTATNQPQLNPSWMQLPASKAPGWGINGPGVSAEWTQGGESEWNSVNASADETRGTISQEIEVPRADDYKVWVRYADWAGALVGTLAPGTTPPAITQPVPSGMSGCKPDQVMIAAPKPGDEVKGTVPGDEFSRALFTVWFGPKPGDENLKRGMLGK